jgi:hypothetical protein
MGPLRGLDLKSNTIVFTIGVVNFKAFQKTPTFFQVYGTNCSKQTKSSHVRKKIHGMEKMWVL